jgi:hypothetical protein
VIDICCLGCKRSRVQIPAARPLESGIYPDPSILPKYRLYALNRGKLDPDLSQYPKHQGDNSSHALRNGGKYSAATVAIAGYAVTAVRGGAVEPSARVEYEAGLGVTAVDGVIELVEHCEVPGRTGRSEAVHVSIVERAPVIRGAVEIALVIEDDSALRVAAF